MNTILMILASQRFRDIEYIVPRAFFEQWGYTVRTASSSRQSVGRFGYKVQNDLLIEDVVADEFDGVYFVGGAGSTEYITNAAAQHLAENFLAQQKPIAAICAAPRNFLHWGILKNKRATGHNGDHQFPVLAEKFGAIYVPDKNVVTDGNILTANGPEASEESALQFLQMLNPGMKI
ncbi:MAG: DJ-1/PfpI family protein [Cytophagaceae bacterium]|nr:DJ-1/PfpI family protein [Cytophagaceae bacterium]MDW8456390.1 DJ-1/PfpI family protein [Cytophagaceae bacterium]